MAKIRIARDDSKDAKFAIEMLKDDQWVVERRFKSKKRAQDHIDNLYRNSDQVKDFKYES